MMAATNRIPRSARFLLVLALVVLGCSPPVARAGDAEATATRVTLQARGIRLDEALRLLQEQTGNPITDRRQPFDADAANPPLDLDLKDVPFLQALDEIARRARVGLTSFTGDGSIAVVAGPPPTEKFVDYSGPFRFELKQFKVERDYQTDAATAGAVIEASWEPRVRPMLLSLRAANWEVRDDQGRVIRPQVAGEAADFALSSERSAVGFTLGLEAPDRSASRLAALKARADATIPAGLKTFRFPLPIRANVEQEQGDVQTTLVKAEVDEHLWRIVIDLDYPAGGLAFESFRQGLFDNRIWLEKADGSRFELNGGSSSTGEGEGRLRFEYLFINPPGKIDDYQLVYEAPSRVIVAPLEFEFRDVPLP